MSKLNYVVIIVMLLAIPCIAMVANYYIRADATAANTGTDWTNAWTSLPSTLQRGDTLLHR